MTDQSHEDNTTRTPHERRDPRYDQDLRKQVATLLDADPDTSVRKMAEQIGRSVSRTHALMVDVKREREAA